MTRPGQNRTRIFGTRQYVGMTAAALAIAIMFALAVVTPQAAQAQTFNLLHDFTGAPDGGNPAAGLTADSGGNLYGTASVGGSGYGLVFKLTHKSSGWILTTLHTFQSGSDGSHPTASVIFGPDGALYGTTIFGGGGPCRSGSGYLGCGTVFRLNPPSTFCHTTSCPWIETVLYRFQDGNDASNPVSRVTFDKSGNLYGTTDSGGTYGHGTVYELQHSNGGWSESILYSFGPGPNGINPEAEVIFDGAGNLYGTAPQGGQGCSGLGCGVVYKLSPSGSGWIETVLYSFTGGNDGADPYGGLIFDPAGNLYGTTVYGGSNNPGGTVFELSPSNGAWTLTTLYSLYGYAGPVATLVMDGVGNLYGTATGDPFGNGSVFKLAKSGSNWIFSDLHVFDGTGGSDPDGPVVFYAAGKMYGTTYDGGTYVCFAGGGGCGTAWEITP